MNFAVRDVRSAVLLLVFTVSLLSLSLGWMYVSHAGGAALRVLPLRAEWVAILPVVFFFRVWIAGDADHPGFGEWIGFFSFQAILIVNALVDRARAEQYFPADPETVMP